jgi:hypothetical protein
MKQKKDKLPSKLFLDKAFGWSSLIILSLFCMESEKAYGDTAQVPGLAIARFALPSISANAENINPTATPVGLKVATLKKNLQTVESTSASLIQSTRELYETVITEVNQYYSAIAEIEAKLQLGTTPANPKLVELRNQALQQLEKLAKIIGMMNSFSTNFTTMSQQVKALLSHTQTTFRLPGAVDEDHAHLLSISGELEQLDRVIGQMSIIITTNIQRQNEWLNMERIRFTNLEKSIERGQLEPSSQGLSLKPAFPKPEVLPLPKREIHKKEHPTHKHSAPMKLVDTAQKNEKNAAAKPLPLTPSPQSLEKKEKEAKANNLSPVSNIPAAQAPKPLTPEVHIEEHAEATVEKTLPKVNVVPHPQVQLTEEKKSVLEESQSSPSQEKQKMREKTIQYSAAIKGRTPLAVLETSQDAKSQKWYLYSSAKRGIKTPNDVVEIISIGDNGKGEEVKNLLIEMGIKSEQLNLIKTQGEEDHAGKVYIYSNP